MKTRVYFNNLVRGSMLAVKSGSWLHEKNLGKLLRLNI